MKKGIIFVVFYGILLSIAFIYREPLLDWIKQGELSQLPIMFILAIFLGVIPVVPFTVFAGLMGAKYGVWIGSVINWTGTVGASAIIFLLARYFFVQRFQQYISRFSKIKKYDEIINRNTFVAVLFVRMIPIVPPPVVNVYSGLSSMMFKTYILATALGKIPGTIIFAYLGNQLFVSFHSFFLGAFIYILFIIIVVLIYRRWYKAKSKAF